MRQLLIILAPIISTLLFLGLVAYIVMSYFGKTEPPGFELAVLSSIFGGLLFSGGFFSNTFPGTEIQREVRRVGIMYLLATIGFVFLVVFLPMTRPEPTGLAYWVIFVVLAISMFGSAAVFAFATARLIRLIPQLW